MKKSSKKSGNTNALTLGLRSGRATLLKGESLTAYTTHIRAFLDALQPRTNAEVAIVHRVADLRWKIQRADRHEHHLLAESQERLLSETDESKLLGLAQRCATAIDAMLMVLPAAKTTNVKGVEPLFQPLRQVGVMLTAVDARRPLPFGIVTDFAKALEDVEAIIVTVADTDAELPAAVNHVEHTGQAVQRALCQLLHEAQRAVRAVSTRLSAAVKLNIATTRTIDRYITALERRIEREMNLLKQIRELPSASSSGSGLPPVPQVELRLVK